LQHQVSNHLLLLKLLKTLVPQLSLCT